MRIICAAYALAGNSCASPPAQVGVTAPAPGIAARPSTVAVPGARLQAMSPALNGTLIWAGAGAAGGAAQPEASTAATATTMQRIGNFTVGASEIERIFILPWQRRVAGRRCHPQRSAASGLDRTRHVLQVQRAGLSRVRARPSIPDRPPVDLRHRGHAAGRRPRVDHVALGDALERIRAGRGPELATPHDEEIGRVAARDEAARV